MTLSVPRCTVTGVLVSPLELGMYLEVPGLWHCWAFWMGANDCPTTVLALKLNLRRVAAPSGALR